MKQKNIKRLDLIGVYENFSIYEIIELIYKFEEARNEFLNLLTFLHTKQHENKGTKVIIERINYELNHVEHNIRVLEDAFMCHETKIIETRNSRIVGVTKFNLN